MIKCEICGKEFEPNFYNRKYCSKKCGEEANRRKAASRIKKAPYPTRKCLCCGKEFRPRVKNQRFCNYKCHYLVFGKEKSLRYKIKKIAEIFNLEIKNLEKIINAKKILFGGDDMSRCPCDANNPDRYCGSARCIADVVYQGHCCCSLFWSKKEPLLKDDDELK